MTDFKILACDAKTAKGIICTTDSCRYNLEEKMRWAGVSEIVDGRVLWVISRPEPWHWEPIYIDFLTRELDFTASSSSNEKIKTYIARHLDAYVAGKKIDPPHMYGVPDVSEKTS